MKLSFIFNSVTTGLGGVIGFLYGGWSMALTVLVTLVVLDYLTGWLASAVEGKLSSAVGFKGIAKKVTIFLIVAVAHLADGFLNAGSVLINASVFFYAANEILSIIENASRIGVPVPKVIKDAVLILKEKGEQK
jgi:toxin secretion/phage lysis holin